MRLPNPISLKAALIASSVLFAGFSAGAQLTGQNKSADPGQVRTITGTPAQLVIETVTVKDKSGKSIPGLTKQDFTLTEDGAPQSINFAEYQTLPEVPDKPVPQLTADQAAENIKIYNKLSREQITTEKPGEVLYKDKRLMVFYFDMAGMPNPADQQRALIAAEKFIREDLTAADLVCIMRYQGASVDTLQDFTADRSRLLSILETMVVGEGQGDTDSVSDSSSADTGAAFGQDDAEFNIFNTDRQLAALQTAVETLAHLNEKKALLYFSSGLNLNGLDNQSQMKATEDAAIKAGVVFDTMDSRGLVALAPMGDATHGSPGGQAMYTGGSISAGMSSFQRSQDTLYELAGDTGGKAFLDNNDLTQGMRQVQRGMSDYYILGYYTTNHELNGKFRKIKVTVNPPTVDAKLDYNQGYYAGKQWGQFTGADKDRQLEDALMLGDPVTDLTIGLELNYFQLNRAEYWMPVMVKVPGSELALAKKRGAQEANLDFIYEVKDDYGGTTVNNIHDHVAFKLSDKSAEQWAKLRIEDSTGFTELPGKFTIKALVRDDATGKIGTFQTTFVIPNLNKETKRVAISSVVLSGEKQVYADAVFNAAKGKEQAKEIAADPLVQNGLKLIPSVTRVFNKARPFYVYLQAYQQPPAATTTTTAGGTPTAAAASAVTSAQPLIAFVSFYQDGKKVYETQPEEVLPETNTRLGVTPMNFTIDLNPLAAGKYDCQVTVLDPVAQKSAYWQAPILLTQ